MRYLVVVLLIGILFGCGAPKVLVNYKEQAKNAAETGNYPEALEAWEQYFIQKPIEETTGVEFSEAAKIAFTAKNPELALAWFDQARYKDFSDAEMYSTLAKIYKTQNNISKELSALEFFNENFGTNNPEVNERLFDVYFEIESFENALNIWDNLTDTTKNSSTKLNSYFLINKELKDSVVCDSVSLVLLEKEPENIEALKWNAKKYYWAGQNRYNSEMAKYNKKKTSKTYKILLKELDLVTADFKKSLPHLNKLWKLEPGKEYAAYLANIYARFGDEKKTNFYKQYRE